MRARSLLLLLLLVLLLTAWMPATVQAEAYENTYANTGDQRADIIGVALTQVGYVEGSNNYTKYGAWYGHPNLEWCGMFVSWCADQAGIPTDVLKKTGHASPSAFGFSEYYTSSAYTPKSGDLFFKKNFAHVGLVYYVDGDYFYTVEGNTWESDDNTGSVMIRKRALSEFYFASPNYSGSSGHNYQKGYASEHPHKEYYQCTHCRDLYYTGNTTVVDTCQSCIIERCSHNWHGTGVIKEATCAESGTQSQSCTVCGASRTVAIAATGKHDYSDWSWQDEEYHKRVCSVCRRVQTEGHDQAEWSGDQAGHWIECATCGEQVHMQAHAAEAECGIPCAVCGYLSRDGHSYENIWQMDPQGHWQTCQVCGAVGTVQNHSYEAECAENCTVCGYVRQCEHSYGTKYQAHEAGHWYACAGCGKRNGFAAHTPGPEATETAAQCCTECGYELAPMPEHIHVYEPFSYDRDHHWGQCVCGASYRAQNHAWNMGTGTCSICGAASMAVKEQTNWDLVWICLCAAAACGVLLPTILLVRKKAWV